VYEQNSRHPSRFVDQTPLDTNLLIKIPAHEKEVSWVIVDTPPTVKKVINDTLIIPDVLFLFNSSKINMQLIKSLNAVMQKIDATKFKAMEITGHTDNKGTTEYNSQLSLNRANAIKDYILTKVKINPAIITVKAEGESRPIASNETNAGRQKNRRVEIVLVH
jgi:outer membrane protein OmpA-like peptidoglycan-associated protein